MWVGLGYLALCGSFLRQHSFEPGHRLAFPACTCGPNTASRDANVRLALIVSRAPQTVMLSAAPTTVVCVRGFSFDQLCRSEGVGSPQQPSIWVGQ